MHKDRQGMLGPARWLVGLMILLLPAVAEAHAGGSDTGLMAGLMHPVFGPDHLLALGLCEFLRRAHPVPRRWG